MNESTKEVLEVKKSRKYLKKRSLNVSVSEHRLDRLSAIFSQKSEMFEVLGESEKIDYILFYLEKFVNASPTFQNEVMECPYEATEQIIARRLQK